MTLLQPESQAHYIDDDAEGIPLISAERSIEHEVFAFRVHGLIGGSAACDGSSPAACD